MALQPLRKRKQVSVAQRSPSFSQVRVSKGAELNVEEITKSLRHYWPDVKGWKEHIGVPLPYFSNFGVVYQVTGRDKVGKSHLLSIIAARHSKHGDVIYVTTEFPMELIHQKLLSLGADPDHLVYIDCSSDPHGVLGVAKLGSNATPFTKTPFYKHFMDVYSTVSGDPVLVVIDSLTSFYEAQEWAGRLLAGNLIRTLRLAKKVLAFAVSQKRTQHSEYNTEVAGGLGVSHILDGTFILSKYRVSPFKRVDKFIRALVDQAGGAIITLRWDGNRWGEHPQDDFWLVFRNGSAEILGNLTKMILLGTLKATAGEVLSND